MERFNGSDPATQALRITDFRENDNIRGFSILLKSRSEYSVSVGKEAEHFDRNPAALAEKAEKQFNSNILFANQMFDFWLAP